MPKYDDCLTRQIHHRSYALCQKSHISYTRHHASYTFTPCIAYRVPHIEDTEHHASYIYIIHHTIVPSYIIHHKSYIIQHASYSIQHTAYIIQHTSYISFIIHQRFAPSFYHHAHHHDFILISRVHSMHTPKDMRLTHKL